MQSGLRQFIQSAEEAVVVSSKFTLVCEDANLVTPECGMIQDFLKTKNAVPGVYYWSMRVAESEYKIYVGKTTSLQRRVKDYLKDFQPHSTNDYKLRIFQKAAFVCCPGAVFILRFSECNISDLTGTENEIVFRLRPLLNQRVTPPESAKATLQRAFEDYYAAGFNALLEDGALKNRGFQPG